MSENREELPPEGPQPEQPSTPDASADDPAPGTPPANPNGFDAEAYIAALKREAKKHRLTPEQLAEIRASLPPVEEREQMYREMQQGDWISAEEFFASLGLEVNSKP